ncbi:MAG TPA: hypothetical protein PKK06_02015 [Phycisphaerae bacterium]|nr:hypothetical protein [Phycisphaerae bacterium]HNU44099.1 hypothetical protein [Phycisphaerae bacterium]
MPLEDRQADTRRTVSSVLALLAMPPYVLCTFTHCCMCGHLAHSHTTWEILTDVAWGTLFVAASVFAVRSNMQWRWLFSAVALGLPASRILAGGHLACFELLVLVAFAFLAARGLVRPSRVAPRHCKGCGYNLTGNVSGVCPECGTAGPTESTPVAGAGDAHAGEAGSGSGRATGAQATGDNVNA